MESVDSNLEKLKQARVLVVGDVMLDQYWLGDVKRISPEAPVPVVAVNETEERIGGAGNVARNITALGGSCTILSVVGDDVAGKRVEEISTDSGITSEIITDPTIKTTIKVRVISRNQQLLRADFESQPHQNALEELLDKYAELIEKHDAVVLSDYGKGGLTQIDALIKLAKSKNKSVLVDPKGNDYSKYRGATMITPNLAEFESVSGEVVGNDDMDVKARYLIKQNELSHLLITLSEKGMVMFNADEGSIHIPARSREVYDVSGAGDTVIAVMAMSLSVGLEKSVALELANSAAGIVVSKLGTATANRNELKAAIKSDYSS